jgi:hypothetical protein
MSNEPKRPDEPKKPRPHDSVNDGNYRGFDPSKPQRFRDPRNRKGPKPEIADGVDFDPHDPTKG